MHFTELFVKSLRQLKVITLGYPKDRAVDISRVDFFDEEANNYIYNTIDEAFKQKTGLALCKFGSIELANVVSKDREHNWNLHDYVELIKGYPVPIFRYKEMQRLCINAGFFPASIEMNDRFVKLMHEVIPDIDILASYVYCERYISEELSNCTKVNLEGFYAPFLYPNPWSRILRGKKVLVIHPFIESIKTQYAKRDLLFENKDVLPEFASMQTIKAIQSIAGNECGYADWFEALESVKRRMEQIDFDIALIGCGAYGLPLAIHAKHLGKVGFHLAGWTQMLFGIYGNRWINDQPEYKRFINTHWIRPNETEVPQGASKVEGGCYW